MTEDERLSFAWALDTVEAFGTLHWKPDDPSWQDLQRARRIFNGENPDIDIYDPV